MGIEYSFVDVYEPIDLMRAADFKAAESQGWQVSQSYVFGPSLLQASRSFRVLVKYYDGLSPNRQFFINDLSYWGLGYTSKSSPA